MIFRRSFTFNCSIKKTGKSEPFNFTRFQNNCRCSCGVCPATCDEKDKGQDGLTHANGTCLSFTLASKVPQLDNKQAHHFSDG